MVLLNVAKFSASGLTSALVRKQCGVSPNNACSNRSLSAGFLKRIDIVNSQLITESVSLVACLQIGILVLCFDVCHSGFSGYRFHFVMSLLATVKF